MTVDKIISTAKKEGRTALTELESKKLLSEAGIDCTEIKLAKTSKEAITAAKKFGFPVVLKIVSPDILHKTDVGGVIVNLKDESQVRNAYQQIMKNVKKHKANA